jgi:very-short-patch-repair endonuclease
MQQTPYELDFADIDTKVDFEVDGSQHYNNEDCKRHDQREIMSCPLLGGP